MMLASKILQHDKQVMTVKMTTRNVCEALKMFGHLALSL
jgi:hypothetical protein